MTAEEKLKAKEAKAVKEIEDVKDEVTRVKESSTSDKPVSFGRVESRIEALEKKLEEIPGKIIESFKGIFEVVKDKEENSAPDKREITGKPKGFIEGIIAGIFDD